MNRKLKYMAVAAVACFAASVASAAVIFHDTFMYTEVNSMTNEGGWTVWSGGGGSDAESGFFWGNSQNSPAWMEYHDTTPLAADKVISAEANVLRTGGYNYALTISLWDGSDTNTLVTVASVEESDTVIGPIYYTTTAGDVGKYIHFKYEHTVNWGETADVTLSLGDPGPPTWNTNPIQGDEATEGLAYFGSLAGLAEDGDGHTITYSKVSGPAWLSVAGDGSLTGTPETSDAGMTNVFTVSASDGFDGSNDATLNIYVAPWVFNPSGSTTISLNFAENDGNQGFVGGQNIGPLGGNSTNWNNTVDRTGGTLGSGSLFGLVDDNGTNTGANVTWTSSGVSYNGDGVGDDQHKLSVGYLDDGAPGLSITVSGIPYTSYKVYGLFASGESTTVMDGHDFQVNGTWVYGGGAFPASAPVYGSIEVNNASNGTYWTETVPGVSTGNYWTVETSGDTLTIGGQPFSGSTRGSLAGIVIQNLAADQQPPVWSESPIEDEGVVGRAYTGTLDGKATDPNGDALTYAKAGGPAWLTVAPDGGLSGTPVTSGTNVFAVTVDDGNLTPVTNTLNIAVSDPTAPVWNENPMTGADGTVSNAYDETLSGLATDPNGDAIEYGLVSGPAWLSVAPDGTLSGTPAEEHGGFTNVFTVFATDNIDGTNNATLNIFVATIPDAPGIVLIDNTTANGSFEEPASGKVFFVNGDVPHWANWSEQDTADNDTGTDAASTDGAQPGLDGNRIAFLQPGGAIVNMATNSPHFLQEGDRVVYGFWNSNAARSPATISLVYDEGSSNRVQIAGTAIETVAGTQALGEYVVQPGDACIGSALGVGIVSGGSWPEVDQVFLGVTPKDAAAVTDLMITGPVNSGSQMVLSWTGQAGASYGVQTNGNLIAPIWGDVATGIPGINGTVTHTNDIGLESELFFQVITE